MKALRTKAVQVTATMGVAAFALAGCAGSAGSAGSGGGGAGGGEGYAHDASDAEIAAAFEDIEPLTITYQPSAQSAEGPDSYRAQAFKKNLEEKSGGKITVDTTYAQGIAGYTELGDALVDGRVDIAYMLPIYQPDEYPVFQAWVTGTTLTGTSPLVDELAANAALGDLAWQDENLLAEFEDKGLVPLSPLNAAGAVMSLCSEPHTTAADWNGNQVRASSTAQSAQLEAVSASPVSLEYTEVFEALQRNTIDCTLTATLPAETAGVFEVANDVAYTTDVTFARGPGGVFAGSAWESWPLAVRQLVFDAMADEFVQSRRGDLAGNYAAAELVREHGGSFAEMDDETQALIRAASEGLVEEKVRDGLLPEGSVEAVPAAVDEWREVVTELGYEDEGTFADFDEWYPDDDSELLTPLGERYFEEVMLPHRPS
ncbi:C4-dicarboxylate ABC transporter substrate-binding protein [Brevibacterium salitolerans]|uniref:TRAP-type C4-dicarboxylate transport system, substrate-binding protein n=1 Tax=Brevibacterium salitolerans TaxID=1403566 RepID=A0ABP5I7Q3_9MICO